MKSLQNNFRGEKKSTIAMGKTAESGKMEPNASEKFNIYFNGGLLAEFKLYSTVFKKRDVQ